MTALRTIAAASLMLLGLGVAANAQAVQQGTSQGYSAEYSQAPLASARSVYVDRAPATDAEADQIVMGLRVPNGLR